MDVETAIRNRRTIRAFLDNSVEVSLIRELLEIAAGAPSNGNLQPWKIYVLTGDKLAQLKSATSARLSTDNPTDQPEYIVYPYPLPEPYNQRRKDVGEALYNLISIPREDKAGRHRQFARNAQLFNAPVGIFAYIDRRLDYGQWLDLGMFLQNLMLAAESRGLATCAQGYWSFFHKTVAEITQAPEELMLVCGIALGYEDKTAKINELKAQRVSVDQFTQFLN